MQMMKKITASLKMGGRYFCKVRVSFKPVPLLQAEDEIYTRIPIPDLTNVGRVLVTL